MEPKLAEAAKKTLQLKNLILGITNLELKYAIALAEALEENTSLKELYIQDNNIGPEEPKYSQNTKNQHITEKI